MAAGDSSPGGALHGWGYGTNRTAELADKGANFWYAKALDRFGRSQSKRSERYVRWGLKQRTNAQAREEYIKEVNPMIKQMGLAAPDPMKGRLYL